MPGGVLPAALNSNLALRLHHFRVEQPKMTDLWPKIGLKTFYGFKPPIRARKRALLVAIATERKNQGHGGGLRPTGETVGQSARSGKATNTPGA